jgi:hypothetical protein
MAQTQTSNVQSHARIPANCVCDAQVVIAMAWFGPGDLAFPP